MEYDKFLDYAFPAFGIALIAAILFIVALIVVAKLRGEKDFPDWLLNALIFCFLASLGIVFLIGWILPWGSPI